jgi:hypothetical protein
MAAPKANVSPTTKTGAAAALSAALIIAQDLWGHGNLSPLDDIFESHALVALAPSKVAKLAVVAAHMGRRLQRYSKDTGLWIDAFESEPELSRFTKEKDAKISFSAWDTSKKPLGAAKFTDLIAFQTSARCDTLAAFYELAAKCLKSQGRIFAADLVLTPGAREPAAGALFKSLKPWNDHQQAVGAAGFKIEKELDLTQELMAKIRHGFHAGTEKLGELRQLEEPHKCRMTAAFCAQLETWATAAMLFETGRLCARALIANKPGA